MPKFRLCFTDVFSNEEKCESLAGTWGVDHFLKTTGGEGLNVLEREENIYIYIFATSLIYFFSFFLLGVEAE